ncbi:acid-sensing ion channel 2-like [Rhipicephalus microplus]|uniref:acid-sensing ion channel 2-like n=1 Tax=Rhipicephalus microplus TaxID=6941 RepID=UPI003F6C070B
MAFPDVTVCNANPLRRSRLCAAQATLHGKKGAPTKVLERNCADNATYDEPNGGDGELFRQLQVWMAQRHKEERSTVRRLFRLGHQLWDMIVYCRYAQKNCTDQMLFSPTFDSHYGNCFCFHCGSTERKNEEFYRYHAATAPEDGLELVLDAQAPEYLPTTTEMGFVVVVHGHGFRPVLCNDVVFVEPGYVTYISLSMEKRAALPEPYQYPCRSSWPRSLRRFSRNNSMYTREDCLYLCEQDHTRSMCGCENRDLPTTSNRRGAKAYPICEELQDECIREVKAIMGLESAEHVCKCHRSCVNVEYHKEVSRAALPESFGITPDGRKRALARVVIYFARDTYLKVTSVPKYSGSRVVSSIGGINGMYLGVSFFVLFGMFDALLRAVRLLWCRPFATRRRHLSRQRGDQHQDYKHGVNEIPDLAGPYPGRAALDYYPAPPIRHRGGDFRSRISVPQVPYSRPQQNVWGNCGQVTGSIFGQYGRRHLLDFKSLGVRPTLLPEVRRQYVEERDLHNN